MIVALLQPKFEPTSQAANVQGIMSAINAAGRASPAPDLLVLPGACDTGGVKVGASWTESARDRVAEMVAWKAREWGIFIAVGVHSIAGDTIENAALLFDPDGDIAVSHTPPDSVKIWDSPGGRIGLIGSASPAGFDGGDPDERREMVIAWPYAVAGKAKLRRVQEQVVAGLCGNPAKTEGAYWVVAAPPGQPLPLPDGTGSETTFACGPDGNTLPRAVETPDSNLWVEIPAPPPKDTGGGA